MKHIVKAFCVALLLTTTPALAEGTKFRGVALEQTMENAERAVKAAGFALKKGEIRGAESNYVVLDSKDRECGLVTIQNHLVKELFLPQCFFGAEGMTLAQFAQKLADNYSLERLDYEKEKELRTYTGVSPTGERIKVLEYFGVIALFVERESGQGVPVFD